MLNPNFLYHIALEKAANVLSAVSIHDLTPKIPWYKFLLAKTDTAFMDDLLKNPRSNLSKLPGLVGQAQTQAILKQINEMDISVLVAQPFNILARMREINPEMVSHPISFTPAPGEVTGPIGQGFFVLHVHDSTSFLATHERRSENEVAKKPLLYIGVTVLTITSIAIGMRMLKGRNVLSQPEPLENEMERALKVPTKKEIEVPTSVCVVHLQRKNRKYLLYIVDIAGRIFFMLLYVCLYAFILLMSVVCTVLFLCFYVFILLTLYKWLSIILSYIITLFFKGNICNLVFSWFIFSNTLGPKSGPFKKKKLLYYAVYVLILLYYVI